MHHTVVSIVLNDAIQALVPFTQAHLSDVGTGNTPVTQAIKPLPEMLQGLLLHEIDKRVAK